MTGDSSNNNHEHTHVETHSGGTRKVRDKQRSFAEWTTLTISIVIIASMATAVTWLHLEGDEQAPDVVVEPQLDALREEDSGWYLPVTVTNEGDVTVADAQIRAELVTGTGEPETGDFVISFLAGGESVEGTFVFQSDPSEGDLTISTTSYKEP